ncbi:MAG TPA: sigma-70 family RNA polymerase sigma factor [Levilinea sp.]|nr:sigma-70 family RNA polymerase sigma factor [Levilinea sp.]
MITEPDFEQLLHKYWTRIYTILFRLTGDPDEAEDLALETFWQYWQRPPPNNRSPAGWLYRVATNLGYNAMRAARRRRSYERHAVQSDPPDPAAATESAEQRAGVRRILQSLPERQARLLILRYSGLSYQEIADALEINPTSVGALLVRAEQAFLKQFDREDDHAPQR